MNNSHQWVDAIIHALMGPEKRRLDRRISDLTRSNNTMKRVNAPGFIYKGEKYIPEDRRQEFGINRIQNKHLPPIAFELMAEASSFSLDKDLVDTDETQLRQLFYKMIRDSNTIQELRDALPDCVVRLMKDLSHVTRQNDDPAYAIRGDHRAMKQYEALLPKIEMYSVTSMLY